MKKTDLRFRLVDIFYIVMMLLPLVFCMALKILTTPYVEGVSIKGARIFFTIPMPVQDFPVTESQVNSLAVLITIFFFSRFITHGISERITLKRQHFAEMIIEKIDALVYENMGEYFMGYAPFVIAILALSVFSSLISLLGLYPPTSDINIVGGWAVLVFFLITYYKFKCGPLYYLKGLAEPVAVLFPINLIGEFATPVSMAFRHYGNVLSGSIISALIATGLAGVSSMILGWLPGFLADIPLFGIGIPAVLSIYFDVFSGCLQAFIFAMLTMVYISGGFPMDEYIKRKQRKSAKIKN